MGDFKDMADTKPPAEMAMPQQAQDQEKPTVDTAPDVADELTKDEYLTGVPLALMTFALMAGIFMIALDNSIIGI
jgi:hypothetical protein